MRILALFLLTLLTACGDPLLILPGGALSGEPTAVPADWSAVAAVETIQVEFRPQDPYSHNIWGVGLDRDLYIATGADGTRWTPFIAADPDVRVRVGTALYDLTAVAVTDAAERVRVADAYLKKYDLDADDNWVTGALIYRLDRRQP
jgi:hypothetical protein